MVQGVTDPAKKKVSSVSEIHEFQTPRPAASRHCSTLRGCTRLRDGFARFARFARRPRLCIEHTERLRRTRWALARSCVTRRSSRAARAAPLLSAPRNHKSSTDPAGVLRSMCHVPCTVGPWYRPPAARPRGAPEQERCLIGAILIYDRLGPPRSATGYRAPRAHAQVDGTTAAIASGATVSRWPRR